MHIGMGVQLARAFEFITVAQTVETYDDSIVFVLEYCRQQDRRAHTQPAQHAEST